MKFKATLLLNGQRYYGVAETKTGWPGYTAFMSYDQNFLLLVRNDFRNLKVENEK